MKLGKVDDMQRGTFTARNNNYVASQDNLPEWDDRKSGGERANIVVNSLIISDSPDKS